MLMATGEHRSEETGLRSTKRAVWEAKAKKLLQKLPPGAVHLDDDASSAFFMHVFGYLSVYVRWHPKFSLLDREEHNDVVIDSILKFLASRGGYDDARPLFPYICRIAYYTFADHQRRKKPSEVIEYVENIDEMPVVDEDDLEEAIQTEQLIDKALLCMPELDRRSLKALIDQDAGPAEIAKLLSRGTSRATGYRGLAKIQRKFRYLLGMCGLI